MIDTTTQETDCIAAYREMHLNPKRFRGYSIKYVLPDIVSLVQETGAKTLLDYGSGKGFQYSERRVHDQWEGIMPTLYDPGVTEFSVKPRGKFDGVICTDVLEHIPEEDVLTVLGEIFSYARLFVVLAVHTGPSRKCLPDGRNCHLTQRPPEWWKERLHAKSAELRVVARFSARG